MTRPKSNRTDWHTLLTLGLSVLGMLFFLIQSLALGGLWLATLFNEGVGDVQNISFGLLLWSSLLSCLLLLPLFLLSMYQLREKPIPGWLDPKETALGKWVLGLILIWPLFVLLGWWVAGMPAAASFLLGPINLLAAGLPVLWIFTTARRKLTGGAVVRQWRIFGFSLTVMPPIVIFVELLAVFFIAILIGILLVYGNLPDIRIEESLDSLMNQLEAAGEDLELILELLRPYLFQPAVMAWALVIFAGVVPIIEEIIKPLALWGLIGREISPQEGFIGGLLCGAGFALMENILYLSLAVTAQDWLIITIGRAGTGALHMLGSGLVGWGLAQAWRDGKWLFLGLTSLGAFILHGLWNALALVVGLAPLYLIGTEPTLRQTILINLPLIVLFLLSLAGLMVINRLLRKQSQHESAVSTQNANLGLQ